MRVRSSLAADHVPAGLGHQIVFGSGQIPLQIALHGGHVVDRLGHHAREFLHAGEAVELQRIETGCRVLGQGQTRLHLTFGLHLDVAQLRAQALQVARQVIERRTRLRQPRIDTRAGNQHFTGLGNQAVQQLRRTRTVCCDAGRGTTGAGSSMACAKSAAVFSPA
jgi:hypothetical protein